MDTDPITRDAVNLSDSIEGRIERLATVDATDAADVATDLATTLAQLLDQVESV